MRRLKKILPSLLLMIAMVVPARAQNTAPVIAQEKSPQDKILDKLAKQYQANPCDFSKASTCQFSSPDHYADYLAAAPQTAKVIKRDLMVRTELERTDKNAGQSGAAGNSSSAVSTGSVPWLLGLALEHGAVTQSVENNLMTFRGNVANIIKAAKIKDYIESYRAGEDNPFVNSISKTSFSVSYNIAQGSSASAPQAGSLAGYSFHFDLYNHRDPRDSRYDRDWDNLLGDLTGVANATGTFFQTIHRNHRADFDSWRPGADATFKALPATPTPDQIREALKTVADSFVDTFGVFDDVQAAAHKVATVLENYAKQKGNVVYKIMHSPILSAEYLNTKQSSTQLPQSSGTTLGVAAQLPDLSTINFIFETYLLKDSQFTLNASTTLFNSLPAGSKMGNIRDFRFAGQTDIPLPAIPNLGKPTLSLSGLFLALLEEPLGQQVLVNGVAESRRGNIGLFQAKFSMGAKNAGVAFPISITASNRTELIKETDVRGSIGVTFNLDALFAKQ
ncbi:MAG TPA: hypothetical protein VE604_07055 [Candidatus Polarisedimenticolia bacterium]|jgi:hypothetical protein|nr:hypothetical protein [Candidatus Polarisedimenticolia bacterium]